jgi:hypothetical protein
MRPHDSRCAATLAALLLSACAASQPVQPPPPDSTQTQAFLDSVEQRTFHYFWDLTNTTNGLTPDRSPSPSFSSIAAVGFALTAYPIGAERGYVTRAQARDRTLTTLQFFWTALQDTTTTGATGYRGFFYHFLDMTTGARFQDVELSTIDSSLLLAGVLTCQSYFDSVSDSGETQIRRLADSIYRRADWAWISPRAPLVAMGWKPGTGGGFLAYDWRGYNEAMILYILALGSPTHPIDSTAWAAWTTDYQYGTFEGQAHVGFAPLFGHQYSHVWIDFQGIRDPYMSGKGIDYFENSRRATLAQRAYAVANPNNWRGYGANLWGLSASDGPKDATLIVAGRSRQFHTYFARGASFTEIQDDGTIAPTALGGSIPFAPEITIPTLYAMRRTYGANLFSTYGFFDALNPTFPTNVTPSMGHVVSGVGWFDTDYLGIDQGPILAMIENYRTGLIWRLMRSNQYVIRGLCRAGFTGGWLATKC